ncbi:uncharacterized protein PHALS_01123 [Plasmopara halstedii]|uniref:RxLR-like protein n=1 Tax=Plasmopara halstedii TaxID=4781 RepID=A0A0P1AT54_PLAHL|nr:uncharacterized protein PHALS_01123 [Plasmopara halstedii]CEG44786.1 hypothetical protein PHALS_01123 [Plasmopara halstedii]|eukprot:XP_024581155.1 hypothetical protein PHALS_01123 [Plasmopara halstedii]
MKLLTNDLGLALLNVILICKLKDSVANANSSGHHTKENHICQVSQLSNKSIPSPRPENPSFSAGKSDEE